MNQDYNTNVTPVSNTPANLKNRFIFGAIILGVLLLFVVLRGVVSAYVFDLLIGFLMVLGAFEIETLMHKMDRPTYSTYIGVFPILTFIANVIFLNSGMSVITILAIDLGLLVFCILAWFGIPLLFTKQLKNSMRKDKCIGNPVMYSFSKSLNSAFVCIWPTLLLSFAFLINHFTELQIAQDSFLVNYQGTADFGLLGLALLFATSMMADTCAMLVGRTIKSPKISLQRLGPGKSWSGLCGGILGAIVASILVYVIFNMFETYTLLFNAVGINFWSFVLAGLFCGICSMLGDIFSSFFKRRAGVKDFSNFLPGHGGIMDRINGIVVNCVAVFVILCVFFA